MICTCSYPVPSLSPSLPPSQISECHEEEDFLIRHATSLDDLQWIAKKITGRNEARSAKEADSFFMAGLTRDFYIGELNGRRICSLAQIWYGDSHSHGGYYFVEKSLREKGYGLKMIQAVYTGDIFKKKLVQAYSILNMMDFYKKLGLQPQWSSRHYHLTTSVVKEKLSGCLPSSVAKILPASQANFEELRAYGRDIMMGSSQTCASMLAATLGLAQESSWVAIGNKGEIVGYVIMNKTLYPEDGYFLSPLFANDASIAQILLQTAVEFAVQDESHSRFLSLDVSMCNLEWVYILENELEAKPIANAVCIGTKRSLHRTHEKIFSHANFI